MTVHGPLSSAMHINDYMDWPVHSFMLSFHDLLGFPLQRLPATVPCCMIFGSVSWRKTWPSHDSMYAWWLTVKAPDVPRGYRPVATHIRLFYALSLICQVFSCNLLVFQGLDSPLQVRRQRPALTTIEQYLLDKWLVEFKLCRKTDGVFFIVLLALSWLSVLAPVWSWLPLLMSRLWFVWIQGIWTDPLLPALFLRYLFQEYIK